MIKFPNCIITVKWCLPLCCNRKVTEQVLLLLIMVYTDDLKGGVTCSICELKIRVDQQLFLENFQTIQLENYEFRKLCISLYLLQNQDLMKPMCSLYSQTTTSQLCYYPTRANKSSIFSIMLPCHTIAQLYIYKSTQTGIRTKMDFSVLVGTAIKKN